MKSHHWILIATFTLQSCATSISMNGPEKCALLDMQAVGANWTHETDEDPYCTEPQTEDQEIAIENIKENALRKQAYNDNLTMTNATIGVLYIFGIVPGVLSKVAADDHKERLMYESQVRSTASTE